MYNPQDEVRKRLQQQQQLQQYRNNQKKYGLGDYTKLAYGVDKTVGNVGQSLAKSSNQNLANLGNNLYKFSGQQALDGFKTKGFDALANGVKDIGSKFNFANNFASNAGNALSGASNALGVAGSALGVGTSAMDMAKNGIDFDNAKDMAVHGASLGAAATGVGVPIAAAIELANGIYNMFNGGKKEAAQNAMQQAQSQNTNKVSDNKQNAMQNIANGGLKQELLDNTLNTQYDMPSMPNNMSLDSYEANIPEQKENVFTLDTITPENVSEVPTEDLQRMLDELRNI